MEHFIAGGPLDPVKNSLIDRSQFKELIDHIEKKSLYIPLCCARQTGKTTLLFRLRHELRKMEYGCVYFYLGNLSRLNEVRFYQRLCDEIEEQLQNCFAAEKKHRPIIENIVDQPSLLDYLKSLALQSKKCRKIIIMLDEVGGVPQEFANSFWDGLRSIYTIGNVFRKFVFIFAGSLDMNDLAMSKNSPLLNVCCSPVALADFSLDQVKQLISGKLKDEEYLATAIHEWTSGHPYLTQKLCAAIEENDRYLNRTLDDYSDFIEGLVEDIFLNGDDPNLIHLFNHLTRNEKHLSFVKKILEGHEAKRSFRSRELEVFGVIARNDRGFYQIRNKIYRESLVRYFEDFDEDL